MSGNHTLAGWLDTSYGNYLLEREHLLFDQGVTDVFGFHALQWGLPGHDLLRASRIPLRVLAGQGPAAQVVTEADELPFESGSMDLVLLPHMLEFSESPHQILREVERVLLPGGQLLLSGFNPRSLWGLRRKLGPKADYPWCGKFISLPRIRDWLELLSLEVTDGRFACYAPPLSNPGWLDRLRFLEPRVNRWWAVCGGVYFLQAIKRVPGMRPIKPKWNGRLVEKLLPVRPQLNGDVSKRSGQEE